MGIYGCHVVCSFSNRVTLPQRLSCPPLTVRALPSPRASWFRVRTGYTWDEWCFEGPRRLVSYRYSGVHVCVGSPDRS